jgi:hypothetical protein
MNRFLILIILFPGYIAKAQEEKKIYESDVLKGLTQAKTVQPVEKLCFDKRFSFVHKTGSTQWEGCFLVNTKSGITISKMLNMSSGTDCNFNVHDKKFYRVLFGMKGNEYLYFNRVERKKQSEPEELKHYVMTGNTHRNPLQEVLSAKILYNKQRSMEFCAGKYKAWEYRSADEKDILYLYGKEYPGDMTAYAYLGAYGLGYLKTSKGNYFVMKQIHGQTQNTITEIEDLENSAECFDPSIFEVYEETKVLTNLQETEKIKEELDRQIARQEEKMTNRNTPCGVKKYELLQYKKEQAEKQKKLLEKMRDGNARYSNPETVKSIAKEYSYIEGIKMERRQTEYDLCILKSDLENGRFKAGSENYSKAIEKIGCWERRVNEYKKYEEDMKAIDERNRNDVDKAIREKGEYYKNNIAPNFGGLRCR